MPPVERIRIPLLVAIIISLGAGCMNPDRAGDNRMARSGDRGTMIGNGAATSAVGDRGQSPSAAASVNSRPSNPDVVRAAGDDAWSPVKSGRIAQVSGSDQGPESQSPSANLTPPGNSPASFPP